MLQFVTLTQLSQPVATPVGVTTSFAEAKWHRGKTRLPDLLVARDVLLAVPARLSGRDDNAPFMLPADIVKSAQRALLALGGCWRMSRASTSFFLSENNGERDA